MPFARECPELFDSGFAEIMRRPFRLDSDVTPDKLCVVLRRKRLIGEQCDRMSLRSPFAARRAIPHPNDRPCCGIDRKDKMLSLNRLGGMVRNHAIDFR